MMIQQIQPRKNLDCENTNNKKAVRIYFCPGSREKMGHFRKMGAKVM